MLEILAYFLCLAVLAPILGSWLWALLEKDPVQGSFRHNLESKVFPVLGLSAHKPSMTWGEIAKGLLFFNLLGLVFVYGIERFQGIGFLNPDKLPSVPPDLALNTAASFVSNTNWQSYSGETTMSYLTQMLALTSQNFLSAATGIAVLAVLCRGLTRRPSASGLGNVWVDLFRIKTYFLLPLSLVVAMFLAGQGVVQTLSGAHTVLGLDGSQQVVAVGPAASQVAIKQLGTNGGGFFGTNSAHPLENPTPLSNFVESLCILLLPAAMTFTFGRYAQNLRHGVASLAIMLVIFLPCLGLSLWSEAQVGPALRSSGPLSQTEEGNLEGKEVRFGAVPSALWATATTAASNGSVNSMHDSYNAMGGFSLMFLMLSGEVVFGGVGCGLYGLLVFMIVSVFIAGQLVGRSPEFLGKKIEAAEIKLCSLVILVPCATVLVGMALACWSGQFEAAQQEPMPHGFSELLYAAASMGNNNGSAFAGFGTNLPFYNLGGAVVMLVSRFWILIPVLALAGQHGDQDPKRTDQRDAPHRQLALRPLHRRSRGDGRRSLLSTGAGSWSDRRIFRHILKMEFKMTSQNVYRSALKSAVYKLDPRQLINNPVMAIVEVGSAFTLLAALVAVVDGRMAEASFDGLVSAWLWFTVLFGNFAEALAEGRGKAQADSLRAARSDTPAQVVKSPVEIENPETRASSLLKKGDLILVSAGHLIPADGEIVRGVATVDESAITGESAPVVRESGGDRSGVTGGTRVLSDWLVIEVASDPGQGFVDRMIALIEGAQRKKTPNEIALTILLASFSFVFLLVCTSLAPFVQVAMGHSGAISPTILVALLVCLIPTTIGGLLSAIGIAGMDRLIQKNVIATSGRAVEAAGDIDVLLLDKTGTITYGNRRAVSFHPATAVDEETLAGAARLSSLADETPEGKSVVALAAERFPFSSAKTVPDGANFLPFTAQTRMSGIEFGETSIRKGAKDAVEKHLQSLGQTLPSELVKESDTIARAGGTPLWVVRDRQALGVIYLKDVVKQGIRERFRQLRGMGIETVMITGDNPVTAAAIAAEAGVDDFLAEATPENKLAKIREYQAVGKLVAMTGDGTNDAPALAQADVGVAMNSGTQPAKRSREYGRPRLGSHQTDRNCGGG